MTIQRNHRGLMLSQLMQTTKVVGGFVAIVLLPLWLAVEHQLKAPAARKSQSSVSHVEAKLWSHSLPFNKAVDLVSQDPEVQERAFMEAIAIAEGNAAYNELYGHEKIHDLTRHPNRCKPIHVDGYEQLCTTAAGRWQITAETWYEYADRLNVDNFGPTAQYRVAVAIARDTGALTRLADGDIRGAMRAASRRWAALPHSPAEQKQVSEEHFLKLYERSLKAELKSR